MRPSARRRAPAPAFRIVGIGASAGGLEAVTRLLKALPGDTGMAFVVVQHLAPSHESMLPAILQASTAMPVAQVKGSLRVAPDRVYVIPPNRHMCIISGELRLRPRPKGIHALAVNCFLDSLAEERGDRAIAVILSGTASDGALGVKAIKAGGGIVFAQDELSAAQPGMPRAAGATGAVDFVMTPEEIAGELARLSRETGPRAAPAEPDAPASLERVFERLRSATGVDFSLYKPSTVRRRLSRRMTLRRAGSLKEYAAALERDPDEVRALHDDLLINVTHFFREPAVFAALRAKVFPRILKALGPDQAVRVWVPGCSSGEEAYSLAIALLDFLGGRESRNPIQVFGTDVSETALEEARAAVYSEDLPEYVPARLLRRFFRKVDRGYEVVKRVRDQCVFARQDLTRDPPFANVDVISCCNVLIYLGRAAQSQVLPKLHYALRPSGALILSKSESVGEFENLFALADKRCRVYYKKPAPPRMAPLARASPEAARGIASARRPEASRSRWPEGDIRKAAEGILLDRWAPAAVVVNSELGVVHFQGRVSRFLEPLTGKPSSNLLRMVPAHLAEVLRALVRKAKRAEAPARTADASWREGKGRVAIEAIPFRLPLSGERYFIVVFEEDSASAPARRGSGRDEGPVTRRLKSELASTRSYLQTLSDEHGAAVEELKSANEEITSANEELQSTNEELEIAKEELQASNEELTTLNEELQTRNEGLSQLNDDLVNLIGSVHLPILMVSGDLRIRRFSPMAERIMNLHSGDVGRPVGEVASRIGLPNIEEIVHGVIESISPKEVEARDRDGRSYSVRIRPYKTAESRIDGAVVVWVDNDPIRRSFAELDPPSAFEAALAVAAPLAVLDAGMRIRAGSRSLYQAFGLTPAVLGQTLFEVDGGRWNVPELRKALERLASEGVPFFDLPVRIGGRTLAFSASRAAGADQSQYVVLSVSG